VTFSVVGASAMSFEAARAVVAGATCRIITDGKAGDLAQCLGVAERLGLPAEPMVVAPRAPWSWLAPYGPPDPRDRAVLAEPFPAIAIASGRRAVPALRALKRIAGTATLTVFLKDPRRGAGTADLIWVPAHDRLRGPNVLVTLTSPHRFSPERLAAAGAGPAPWGAEVGRVPVAVLLGGESRNHHFTDHDISALSGHLAAIARGGARVLVTPSRRTPAALHAAVTAITAAHGGWMWDGSGENPYPALLARAQHFIVTADSVNMAGEAAATGRPIHLFRPSGGHPRLDAFLDGLARAGAARPLDNRLEDWTYPPLDATPAIAIAVAGAYADMTRRGRRGAP
jgi:hypothetical protein